LRSAAEQAYYSVTMRALWLLPRIFAAVGAALLALTFWLYSREQAFVAGASHAVGTVVQLSVDRNDNGSTVYYPIVAFTTARGDSVTVRSKVGSNPPSWRVGDAVDVLYDPADPQGARLAGFFHLHIGSFVFGILGLVFGAIGGIWLYLVRRAAAMAEEVRAHGQRIQAKVIEIERRTNIRVGSKHPFRIIAQGEASGGKEVVLYRSANIWFDPTEYVGDTVTVFVDHNDPSRHVVDLDFLPKLRE
jgi:hypothetical protein